MVWFWEMWQAIFFLSPYVSVSIYLPNITPWEEVVSDECFGKFQCINKYKEKNKPYYVDFYLVCLNFSHPDQEVVCT